MPFTFGKFAKTFIITIIVGMVAFLVLRQFGVIGVEADPDSPEELVRTATENLTAVRERTPADRRPASYDSVLAPLDKLLSQCKALLDSDGYDPVGDYAAVRARANPVIDIATRADSQSREATAMVDKEYRFNAQKAEACQYLANAMWERILRRQPPSDGFFGDQPSFPAADMEELRDVLDMGVAADPENAELWYIRGTVDRAEGLFAAAADDLERSLMFKNDYSAAWNTLGLVRINLKEFDKAEEALERARASALQEAKSAGREAGAEYTAILYNLGSFHANLAAYYQRENRIERTVENERLGERHGGEARKYLGDFLSREPAGTPDAEAAKALLQGVE